MDASIISLRLGGWIWLEGWKVGGTHPSILPIFHPRVILQVLPLREALRIALPPMPPRLLQILPLGCDLIYVLTSARSRSSETQLSISACRFSRSAFRMTLLRTSSSSNGFWYSSRRLRLFGRSCSISLPERRLQ